MGLSKSTPNLGLGRIASVPDPIRLTTHAIPRRKISRTHRYHGFLAKPLDQGELPQCVAYGGNHLLRAMPVVNRYVPTQALYDECQDADEWPGNNYDGTSVAALMKVLKRRGLIGSYKWAKDVDTLVSHLLADDGGPVAIGVNWYRSMFFPDERDFIEIGGPNDGGHFVVLLGGNTFEEKVQGINTWGLKWGNKGRFWMRFPTLRRLIEEDGEIACAQEVNLT
jgi:hypothetical protein